MSVGNGIREWAIAGGRKPNGGLSAIPVDLTINGTKQVDATLTIGFLTKGQPGAGELDWDGSRGDPAVRERVLHSRRLSWRQRSNPNESLGVAVRLAG